MIYLIFYIGRSNDCIKFSIFIDKFEKKTLNQTGLLSVKPKIFVCNVDEQSIKNGNKYTKAFIDKYGKYNTIIASADIENQINQLDHEERVNYMKMIDIKETGLDVIIRKGYEILQLDTFFTSGPKNLERGQFQKIVPHLRLQESFIQTLKKALLDQKLLVLKIL